MLFTTQYWVPFDVFSNSASAIIEFLYKNTASSVP